MITMMMMMMMMMIDDDDKSLKVIIHDGATLTPLAFSKL